MDICDQKHISDLIEFTEDDLVLYQDVYSIFEKWKNTTEEKLINLVGFRKALFEEGNNRLKENKSEVNKLEIILNNIANDCNTLIQMNMEVENKELDLKKEVESVEAQIKELLEAKTKLENDKELDMLKKKCKASKLLTGTIFDYQGSNVTGIIFTPDNSQNFNFDGTQLKPEAVCKQLWQTLAAELGVDKL